MKTLSENSGRAAPAWLLPAAVAMIVLCAVLLFSRRAAAEESAPAPLWSALTEGKTYAGTNVDRETGFSVNIGGRFTLAATVTPQKESGIQVLFAKGDKTAGHYELWLNNGEFCFYAPEINGDTAIYTGAKVTAGEKHHVAFVYDSGDFCAYLDGGYVGGGHCTGSVSGGTRTFALGGLVDGSYPYYGRLEQVEIYGEPLDDAQIAAIATVTAGVPDPRERNYDPKKYQPTGALRGVERLAEPAALPYLDLGATTGYEGSIDPTGGNADWNWGTYRDEQGDWVLFEAYGPGCIYNFTQHRYPTSEEPVFRFYLDDGDTPAYEIRQSEFGTKAPFLSPVADRYEGPADNGRGPIWVVRSFLPLSFSSYCRVTSSVKLEGADKAAGQGGWGHVTYVLYDTPQEAEDAGARAVLDAKLGNLSFDPKYSAENRVNEKTAFTVAPGAPVVLLNESGAGSVSAVRLTVTGVSAKADVLHDLRIRMYWDGEDTPSVDAPIGTFFGGEYGKTAADNTLLMLGLKVLPNREVSGYNYFPMPFFDGAKVELYTVGGTAVTVASATVEVTPASVVRYDKEKVGYFVSSEYYEPTANVAGENSVIAEMEGTGHMVYGTLSGYGINVGGCEGDVRVFFDGRQAPEIESDGSESWASYGWGFVTPPQYNPFSGYNGQYGSNANWSEVRLTLGDSYYFKESLVFELEHGNCNDGMGRHSGQIFCYLAADEHAKESDRLDVADEDSRTAHGYTAGGGYETRAIRSAYANGLNAKNAFDGTILHAFGGAITFRVAIEKDNAGVVLIRRSSQKDGRQAARVAVDGVPVAERPWFTMDNNAYFLWTDDSFTIPAAYTAGKESITVTITPTDAGNGNTWNESTYRVLSILPFAAQEPQEPQDPQGGRDDPILPEKENGADTRETPGFPVWPVLITAAVLLPLGGVCGVLIGRKRRKK